MAIRGLNMTDQNNQIEEILSNCLQVSQRNLLRDVMSYNDSMTISQVIKFFQRQGVLFTKAMIQHYVRAGVIPPPEDKRRYTRIHLLMLAILGQLKGIYTLEDIGAAFSWLTSQDNLIKQFQDLAGFAVSVWQETLGGLVDKAAEAANGMQMSEQESRRIFQSFVILGIMMQSAAAVQTVSMLINEGKE